MAYINVNETARRLNRSIEQVRRYLREGKLRGQRIGGHWFVDEDAVAALRAEASRISEPAATYEVRPMARQKTGEKNAQAIALLDTWLTENSEEQQETWAFLSEGLERDRLSSRKLFS